MTQDEVDEEESGSESDNYSSDETGDTKGGNDLIGYGESEDFASDKKGSFYARIEKNIVQKEQIHTIYGYGCLRSTS